MIETLPLPIETVTPIRPSEAMRLGCLLFPIQHFGNLAWRDRACALGAMYAGYGDNPRSPYVLVDAVDDAATLLYQSITVCPDCDFGKSGTDDETGVVAHLNDDHRWSRERIVDWLERLGL